MVNKLSKLWIGLFSLLLMQSQVWAVAGWTTYGFVTELNPTTEGRFLVALEVDANPSGCRNKSWFYRDYSGLGTDHMFHALLGSITAGKRVRVFVTGRCDLNGYSGISSASIIP